MISFGRDFDDKSVLAPDFDTLLAWLAAEAGAGRVQPKEESIDWHTDGHLVSALELARLGR